MVEDPDRIGPVNALGLDEALFAREGPFRRQRWSTQSVDVRRGQLLDVVAGRDRDGLCRWLAARPTAWMAGSIALPSTVSRPGAYCGEHSRAGTDCAHRTAPPDLPNARPNGMVVLVERRGLRVVARPDGWSRDRLRSGRSALRRKLCRRVSAIARLAGDVAT